MAWNKPAEGGQGKGIREQGSGKSPFRGLVAGAIVVIGAAVAAWWLWPEGGREEAAAPEGGRHIREVKPALAPKAKKAAAPVSTNRPPQRVGELRDGYRLLPNGRLHKVVGVTTSSVVKVTLAERIFPQATDVAIAEMLTIEPGTSFLGDSKDYYRNFDKLFLESLKEPIIVGKNDSDEAKELKRAVIDMRKELKARYDAGEDLNQIMRDSREQFRELGLYREELEREVSGILKGGTDKEYTERDVQDLVDAANKMLQERGSKPMSLTGPMAYRLRRQAILNERAKQKKENGK